MNCPKCEGQALVSTRIGAIDVDRCERCKGCWFDEHELGNLLGLDRDTLKPLRGGSDYKLDGRGGSCPRDGAELLRVLSSRNRETILDTCPQCRGIWLDGGEFDRLRQAGPRPA